MVDLKQELSARFSEEQILLEEPMWKHTTFKIGGAADMVLLPRTQEDVVFAVETMRRHRVPFYVIGNGSNTLVRDGGVRGCIVKLLENYAEITRVCDTEIYACAGAGMWAVARKCVEFGLGGMEFASGIPGTVGGTVSMNAGAYDHEMKDIVKSVRVLTPEGDVREISNADMQFSYRHSATFDNNWIVLGATFSLTSCDRQVVAEKIDDFNARRKARQPLMFPSAGSAFKRPEGYFAAKLIDDSGMKGASVGGAQVSEMHAGFIINRGGATANDVLQLMERVEQAVYGQFGVMLSPEFKIIGEDRI